MLGISFELAMIFMVGLVIGGIWHISTQLKVIIGLLHDILIKE
jgi:hypothetical protein